MQAMLQQRLIDGSFVSAWLPAAKPYVNFAVYGTRVASINAANNVCVANCELPPLTPPPAATTPPFPPAPPRPPRGAAASRTIV